MIEVVLKLRKKFKHVRRGFAKYERSIRDDSLPLKTSLDALTRLEEVCADAAKRYGTRDVTEVAEWRDILDIIPKGGLRSEHLDGNGVAKFLLNQPLKKIVQFIRRRRALYLFRMKNRFFEIENYSRLIEKVYGHEVNEEDISYLRNISNGGIASLELPEP